MKITSLYLLSTRVLVESQLALAKAWSGGSGHSAEPGYEEVLAVNRTLPPSLRVEQDVQTLNTCDASHESGPQIHRDSNPRHFSTRPNNYCECFSLGSPTTVNQMGVRVKMRVPVLVALHLPSPGTE
ncbi:hypothetical protein RRG08_030133 [Elysia crispata]|uniref:Uncharacterized protein n=1 Tax=Elysia crispata TaxID=231223 RepID=A0AAE0ZS59_9GAST|nr:hypothetical protein RRG08_030133 [Elysia crispata]